jgi:hypothetical protein
MIAYEFYRRAPLGEDRLIDVLPGRRKNPERISRETSLNFARILVSKMSDAEFSRNIYFLKIEK